MIENYYFPIEGETFDSFWIFDRDDTLIRDIPGLKSFSDVVWIPGRLDFLRQLSQSRVLLAIATNQSAIGRGELTSEDFKIVSQAIANYLTEQGIYLWAIVACPHLANDDCVCRKPKPALLNHLVRQTNRVWEKVVFVGNASTDLEAAESAETPIIGIKLDHDERLDFESLHNRRLRLGQK